MGSQRDALVRLLSRDVEFLRNNGMISYSLVLVVGKLVAPEGEKIDVSLVEQEKRGLVESAFGQWVLLAGIYNVWFEKMFPLLWKFSYTKLPFKRQGVFETAYENAPNFPTRQSSTKVLCGTF